MWPEVAMDAPAAYKPATSLGAVTDQHAVCVPGLHETVSGSDTAYTESRPELIHGIECRRFVACKREERRFRSGACLSVALHASDRHCQQSARRVRRPTRDVQMEGELRDRKFADSSLEGTGFELSVRGRGQSGCRPF